MTPLQPTPTPLPPDELARWHRLRLLAGAATELTFTGPFHYDDDLHPCFRVDAPDRLVACVYIVDGDETYAEAICERIKQYPALLAQVEDAVCAVALWKGNYALLQEKYAAMDADCVEAEARAEAAEAKVVELEDAIRNQGMPLIRKHVATIDFLQARITALEAQQRTPGTVEVCGNCRIETGEPGFDCGDSACPIRPARTQPSQEKIP